MSNSYENFKSLIEKKKKKYPNICKLWRDMLTKRKQYMKKQ